MDNTHGLSEHLRAWRKGAGLRQEDVAAKLGISQSTVSAAERGTYSATLLERLVDLYSPSPRELHSAMVRAEAS